MAVPSIFDVVNAVVGCPARMGPALAFARVFLGLDDHEQVKTVLKYIDQGRPIISVSWAKIMSNMLIQSCKCSRVLPPPDID